MEPQTSRAGAPLLQVVKGSKVYGGLHAIEGVDFELRAGEIHALLGENGAGKSTLCKAIAGRDHADFGRLSDQWPKVEIRVAAGSASGRRRDGLSGVEPRAVDDGRAKSRTRYGEAVHDLQQDQYRRHPVAAVAKLQCRSTRRWSRTSARPSGRWWRSSEPCDTTLKSSSSTSRPHR